MNFLRKFKHRLGELWWYALVLFVMQRMGDFINAFIGLWLVPKYIPTEELGAVLPLVSLGGVLGLPLTVLMIPFMKFLSVYIAQGAYGKVKALLRDVFLLTLILAMLIGVVSFFLISPLFVRMRVENGHLGFLILLSGIVMAVAPVFVTALQAAKKFKLMSCIGVGAAFMRLGTLLVALPIRGLSGYFVGQVLSSAFSMTGCLLGLRKFLSRQVQMTPYFRQDFRKIATHVFWTGLVVSSATLMGFVENLVIRHRLPNSDSAAYYVVSRFSEIALYIGVSIAAVVFPVASMQSENGTTTRGGGKIVEQAMLGCLVGGTALSIGLVIGWPLLSAWIPGHFVGSETAKMILPVTLMYTFRGVAYCYMMHELAVNQFKFVKFFFSGYVLSAICLYSVTGYEFFQGVLPDGWIHAIRIWNPCRMSVVLTVMLVSSFVILLYCWFCGEKPNENRI